jgi:predicted secreted protein
MATSAVAGYKGKVLASTESTGGVTSIAEVKNFNLTAEMAEIDATSHDSSGDREVIGGTGSWSGTAEYLQVMANATHQEAYDVLVGRTLVAFEFYPTGSSGDGYYSGTGYFNNWELASPNDDALAVSVSLVGTGALSRG